ncbi:DUF1214 domain-containing protein [Vibrio campbellii]|uniref:DUF1214 domain-containing protein n=1 Tax=Vibrio campbellii TaxID=680 RepID=UPI002F3F42FD
MKLKYLALSIFAATTITLGQAQASTTIQSFDTTDNILERASQIEDLDYKIMVQRATQTAIWAMPAVTQVDFLNATRRELGGDYNDVLYVNKPFASNKGFLTANDVTAYAWGTMTSRSGPIVIEVPAASDKVSYFGSVVNQWEQPIVDVGPAGADKGKGGKYVFLPPNYTGSPSKSELETKGYIVSQTDTLDYGFSFRPRLYNGATDKDAGDYAKRIKIYELQDASNPPKTDHLNVTDVDYDCLPYYNETFFQDVNKVVQNNPIREQDKVMVSLLKDLGIEKGKPFNPTDKQLKAMSFVTDGYTISPLWKDKKGKPLSNWAFWNFGDQPYKGFTFEEENEVLVDKRASSYFYVTYLPKKFGGETFYLTGVKDSNGEMLDGESTYKLNVPKDTPVKDFWSVIVYSMETKNFIKGVDRVGLSSRNQDTMRVNEDGSYDIYFGPKAPAGMEENWVPTNGEDFFLLFRLYGPKTKDFYKTWMLGDLEKID